LVANLLVAIKRLLETVNDPAADRAALERGFAVNPAGVAAARDLGPKRITVNNLQPGPIDTT
jgi:hypothetical protein